MIKAETLQALHMVSKIHSFASAEEDNATTIRNNFETNLPLPPISMLMAQKVHFTVGMWTGINPNK